MTTRSALVAAAFALGLMPALQAQLGPLANTRTMTGTVVLEATAKTAEGDGVKTQTYSAQGNFTLTNDAMPAGGRFQWPMVSPGSTDLDALRQWTANVTYKSNWTVPRLSASSTGGTVVCEGGGKMRGIVSVAAPPVGGIYVFSVTPPNPDVRCTGTMNGEKISTTGPVDGLFEQRTHQGKVPGRYGEEAKFTDGDWAGTLKYSFAPSGQ